jgi:hypothetical protein
MGLSPTPLAIKKKGGTISVSLNHTLQVSHMNGAF